MLVVLLLFAVAVSSDDAQQPNFPIEKSRMQIKFERSGGFGGIRMATKIDSETLPEPQARRVRELVENADFFSLPSTIRSEKPAPDRFRYKVTVETKGQTHTAEIDEGAVPSSLRPLLEWLTTEAHKTSR